MRQFMAEGKLTEPPAALMDPNIPEEQLFDTEADPHEIRNLAASPEPEHREALIRMRAALSVWMVETQDQGVFPEPPKSSRPLRRKCTTGSAHPIDTAKLLSETEDQFLVRLIAPTGAMHSHTVGNGGRSNV